MVRVESTHHDGEVVVERVPRELFEVPENWQPIRTFGIYGEYVSSDFESINTWRIHVTRENS